MRKVRQTVVARRWAYWALAVIAWGGCGGSERGGAGGECRQGERVSCRCENGDLGQAVCEERNIYGACHCGHANGGESGQGSVAGGAHSAASGGQGAGPGDASGGDHGGTREVGNAGKGEGNTAGKGLGGAEVQRDESAGEHGGGEANAGGGEASAAGAGDGGSGSEREPLPLGACVSQVLPYEIVDAEFSYSLNRVVALTSDPAAVVLINPATGGGNSVELPISATSISVAPSGHWAATAHDGYVSIIDLQEPRLDRTIATTTVAGDIVMTDNQFAYLLPKSDQRVGVHSIDIAAEEDLGGNNGPLRARSLGKLHPSGDVIYAITVALSPPDLQRYDISGGVASLVTGSPYHGDYSMCGDLWISKDGARIFTGCGTAFRADPHGEDDFLYDRAFEGISTSPLVLGTQFASIEHDSANGLVYALKPGTSLALPTQARLEIYAYQYLASRPPLSLPCLKPADNSYPNGRFVFASQDGVDVYVLAQTTTPDGTPAWSIAVSTRE